MATPPSQARLGQSARDRRPLASHDRANGKAVDSSCGRVLQFGGCPRREPRLLKVGKTHGLAGRRKTQDDAEIGTTCCGVYRPDSHRGCTQCPRLRRGGNGRGASPCGVLRQHQDAKRPLLRLSGCEGSGRSPSICATNFAGCTCTRGSTRGAGTRRGACPSKDGMDGVQTHVPNAGNSPVDEEETRRLRG